MSLNLDLRHLLAAPVMATLALAAASSAADTGSCFVERGRIMLTNISAVAVSGRLVAVVQRGSWDTRPMVRVVELGPFGLTETGSWHASWYVSDIALEAATSFVVTDGGLLSLDLSDPHHPAELDFVDLMDAQHLAVAGGHVFVATSGVSGNGWFDIIDRTDIEAMEKNGQLYWDRPDPWKSGIDATGDLVAIADDLGLLIIDVSEPWQPEEAGRWSHSGVQDVALIGHLAVAAVTGEGDPPHGKISLVDLSNPAAPALIGTWQAPGAVWSVAEYGGAAIVGTESDGLFLIDVSDPASPTVIDQWAAPGLSIDHLATAWPTVAFSDVIQGAVVLSLHRSCLPPRRPSGRVGP